MKTPLRPPFRYDSQACALFITPEFGPRSCWHVRHIDSVTVRLNRFFDAGTGLPNGLTVSVNPTTGTGHCTCFAGMSGTACLHVQAVLSILPQLQEHQ